MNLEELKQRFLVNRDHTGRFIIYSPRTGITYFVEPLDGGEKKVWGDMDPASKDTTGSYGQKYKGSIRKEESLITEENGFKNIEILSPGISPNGTINEIDDLRYEQGYRPVEI